MINLKVDAGPKNHIRWCIYFVRVASRNLSNYPGIHIVSLGGICLILASECNWSTGDSRSLQLMGGSEKASTHFFRGVEVPNCRRTQIRGHRRCQSSERSIRNFFIVNQVNSRRIMCNFLA